MSRWYRFLYRVGFTPWESDTESLATQIGSLLTVEEATRHARYGRALDLGCGTGRWSVEMAQRGWDVAGVDVVPRAIAAARRRAAAAGVEVDFVEGDVTTLREAGIGAGFSLFLDVECFNHLADTQRQTMGREVDAIATEDASMLLLVWTRARRGPLPPGAGSADLRSAFPGWAIVDQHPYEGEMPRPLQSAAPCWYRLSRTERSPEASMG